MPNQFLSDEFGDIEDYFVTDYWLIDNFVGDQLWVWGENEVGSLGINNTTNRPTPVTTFAGGTTWKQVASGSKSSFAIKTDGSLWVWGSNGTNQLGTNTNFASRSTPVTTFTGGNNWKQVSAGFGFTVAIKTDGTLWGWGVGANGQLGNENSGFIPTPVTTFAGGTNWKQVSAGTNQTVAIKTDGSLWTWGLDGVLGINASGNRDTPVTTFAGGNDWKQVSGGQGFTAAIKNDGSLWVWGNGGYGKLGVNDTTNRPTPVTTFAGGNNWKQVSCGFKFMSAIKTDGSLWTWGIDGVLGINAAGNRSTPVTTFAGGTNWKQVSAGTNHIAAIKTDGSLWVWGASNSRALGIPQGYPGSPSKSTPVTTFAGGNNWKYVSAGYQETIAIKSGLNVDLS